MILRLQALAERQGVWFSRRIRSASRAASSTPILTTVLRGANEVPPNGSSAIGVAIVDLSGNVLTVNEIFVGLVGGPATAAHIHCCGPVGVTEPVAVPFPGFPAATFGTYSQTFDLTSLATYNAPFVAAKWGHRALRGSGPDRRAECRAHLREHP